MKIIRIIIFFTCTLFLACRPDTQPAEWDVQTLTPILKSRLDIGDIVADSVLSTNGEGLLSLVYRNRLSDLTLDEIIKPINSNFLNTVKLQSIDLGTRTVENKITLGQFARSTGGFIGLIIVSNHNGSTNVPAILGVGPETYNIDASQFFQTITLQSGLLIVSLKNDFPIELTNIRYRLENQSGGVPLAMRNVASIPPNTTYIDSVDLSSTVLEGNLKAVMENIDSPGDPNSVPIDTSKALEIKITITDLIPTSATAIFPDQNIVNDTTDSEVDNLDDAELTQIVVDEGKLFIDATSTIEDIVVFNYVLPKASLNGTVLTINESLPAAAPGGSSSKYVEVPIEDYTLDLSGIKVASPDFNTIGSILKGRIDSSGNLITLSLQDSIYLNTGILNLTAKRAFGYLGKDTVSSEDTSLVDFFEGFTGGTFDLDEFKLSVEVENYFGAPVHARFNSLASIGPNLPQADLNWAQLGQLIAVPPATLSSPTTSKPSPGIATFQLDKSNSNIDELFENQPDRFIFEVDAFANAFATVPDRNQFVFLEYGLSTYLTAEIPLNLSLNNISLADTSEFDYFDLDSKGRLQRGELRLVAENTFPLESIVEIVLLDEQNNILDTLSSSDKIEPALTDANGRSIQMVKSTLSFPLAEIEIANLKNTTKLVFLSAFTTVPTSQAVKFYSDNYMDLKLVGDLTLRTK